jgi:hypothetical protein
MLIDANGYVGINETNPGTFLDIRGSQAMTGDISEVLRIAAGGGQHGYGPAISFFHLYGGQFDWRIADIAATYQGGSEWAGNLVFRVNPDGSSGAISEAMRIIANGNVGIGTASPDFKLEVSGTIGSLTTYSEVVGGGNLPLNIDATGKLGIVSSSKRYKKNIIELGNTDWIYQLRPVEFDYKIDNTHAYGLIAEEVEIVNPDFVSYKKNGEVQTVKYNQLITPMLKEIQNLKADNEALRRELEEIKKMLLK